MYGGSATHAQGRVQSTARPMRRGWTALAYGVIGILLNVSASCTKERPYFHCYDRTPGHAEATNQPFEIARRRLLYSNRGLIPGGRREDQAQIEAYSEESPTRADLHAVTVAYVFGRYMAVAVGDGGVILSRTLQSSWRTEPSPTSSTLTGIMQSRRGYCALFAVGHHGTILRLVEPSRWQLEDSGTERDLLSIGDCWSRNSIVATGRGGVVVEWTPASESTVWHRINLNVTTDLADHACMQNAMWFISQSGSLTRCQLGQREQIANCEPCPAPRAETGAGFFHERGTYDLRVFYLDGQTFESLNGASNGCPQWRRVELNGVEEINEFAAIEPRYMMPNSHRAMVLARRLGIPLSDCLDGDCVALDERSAFFVGRGGAITHIVQRPTALGIQP